MAEKKFVRDCGLDAAMEATRMVHIASQSPAVVFEGEHLNLCHHLVARPPAHRVPCQTKDKKRRKNEKRNRAKIKKNRNIQILNNK
jgi:hypothetical protein